MRKADVIPLFAAIVLLVAGNAGYSRTIAPPYEVGTWQGFRTAAVSYTFDDGTANQLPVAIPIFNQYNFDATLFTVTSWVSSWNGYQAAAAAGHEIASHTVDHTRLGSLSEAAQIYQYSTSQNTINANIPGNQCLTIAYPNCQNGDYDILAQYFISGRNCSGANNSPTPSNWFEINSYICGSRGSVKTLADFLARFDSVQTAGGWLVLLLHGIDNDGGYSPLSSAILNDSLAYLDSNRNVFWVATYLNVVRYIKERDDVSVIETGSTVDSITLAVTDTLDYAIYNCPVSIRRPLPAGWASATVTQNGSPVNSSIVAINSVNYVMFDVVPDGGVVVLEMAGQSQAPAAPTGLTAAPGTGTVSLDWNNNNEPDLDGYNVYRSTTSGGGYAKLNGPLVTASAYTDNTVINGTTYYYVVTAVNTDNYESPYSGEVSATPTGGGATSMHVHSIVVTTVAAGGPNKKGRATVVIRDNNGNPVPSATITGTFSGTFNETRTGTTDATGTAVIDTYAFQKTISSLQFCVDNVTHSTLTYNSSANVETCDHL